MPIENECQTTTNEMYPELEVTVAAFSGGPIGPGDRYDTFNKTLIMATWYSKSCMCCVFIKSVQYIALKINLRCHLITLTQLWPQRCVSM